MLNVAVQMDPVQAVNIEADTSFMLAMEAQQRGHKLWFHGPQNLALEDGELFVRPQPLEFRAVKGDHFTLGEPQVFGRARRRSAMLFPGLRSSMSRMASAETSPSS